MSQVGAIQVIEQDEVHGDGDGDGHVLMMIKLQLKKKKEKNKNKVDQGKGIAQGFSFGDQDTIEGVITFRVDSRTIKGESFGYLVS